MKASDIRTSFIEFFRQRGHEWVPSSSLVPANDPTLLFTNAGMVQFKEVFLGREKRDYTRAVSSQRCVRAGGKHNDLENVGYTARHHTFFEMLGNFSFGDYFKKEAIEYAWEYLTKTLEIPAERLWVTVFEEDDEAAKLWLEHIGVDPKRFSRIGTKDNFWSMGDTGPCGPCTEIFYDHGSEVAGGPPGTPEEDGDRYVEIWNLVFMQYDRKSNGELVPLPKPSVDTGMGLERLAAVKQGVHSNYDIDLFQHLIRAAARETHTRDLANNSLKVIADHIRSCSFLIVDGVLPSNEGRGYVLRRIIRRAARHGYELGMTQPFFYRLVPALVEVMGDAYPELVEKQSQVEAALKAEEERFAETLENGMKILNDAIARLDSDTIPGDVVFKLYDTYGFPVDLTEDIAHNKNLKIDHAGFEAAMEAQRQRARAASHFAVDYGEAVQVDQETEFTGYDHLTDQANVLQVIHDGKPVERLAANEEGIIVLDKTPFYAESGGQVGDHGMLVGSDVKIAVNDVQKQGGSVFLHHVKVIEGGVKPGDSVQAKVDAAERLAIARNHSATHLLHAALRKILGEHVTQKGSLVDAERLRFDFSHPAPMTPGQLAQVEQLVNEKILENLPVQAEETNMEEAKKKGAMALFGEKYGDTVRVLSMGDFSVELCGGTHVTRTGDIGLFKIVAESGIASGVRRIEAITGQQAFAYVQEREQLLAQLAGMLKTKPELVVEKVSQLVEKNRKLEKDLQVLQAKLASSAGEDLEAAAVDVNGCKVVAARLEGVDAKTLRDTVDKLKNKLGSAAVVLAVVENGKVRLVAGVTKDQTDKLKAGDLVNWVAQQVGGKGGGRPDMAQAGGTDPSGLKKALKSVPDWVKDQLT